MKIESVTGYKYTRKFKYKYIYFAKIQLNLDKNLTFNYLANN